MVSLTAKSAFLLHPTYRDSSIRRRILAAYKANPLPSVQLQGFFELDSYAQLVKQCKTLKWQEEYVPNQYRRAVAKLPAHLSRFFASKEFVDLVLHCTGKKLSKKARLVSYGASGFTLRNDEAKPPGLLVYFDMTHEWSSKWGGATVVSSAYGELARVQPMPNTLVLIDCSKAWPFVQYINHYAANKKIVRIEFN